MRALFVLILFCAGALLGEARAASFDCAKAQSAPEIIICGDAELSRLDGELAPIFAAARARAAEWAFAGDGATSVSDWFAADATADWTWREQNCRDRECVLRWLIKRRALLEFAATSDEGFGDGGIAVRQLADRSVLLAVSMTTHVRNFRYAPDSGDYAPLANGDLMVLSEAPFVYGTAWEKGYFEAGGAFWYDAVRDEAGRLLGIGPADAASACFGRAEFAAVTAFSESDLALVRKDEICVSR